MAMGERKKIENGMCRGNAENKKCLYVRRIKQKI
jgi:hypothetical protein